MRAFLLLCCDRKAATDGGFSVELVDEFCYMGDMLLCMRMWVLRGHPEYTVADLSYPSSNCSPKGS